MTNTDINSCRCQPYHDYRSGIRTVDLKLARTRPMPGQIDQVVMVLESLKMRWHCLSPPQDFYQGNSGPGPEARRSTATMLRPLVLYRLPTGSQRTRRKGRKEDRSTSHSKAMEDEVPGRGATPGIEAKPRWRSWQVSC
ncbi:hypothetical protein BDV09DRAFT_157413 [Aspergillus tetrazonus]